MRTQRFIQAAALAALLVCGKAGQVQAQWRDQTITLQPGWNAVFLEVQPQPRASEAVFASLPTGLASAGPDVDTLVGIDNLYVDISAEEVPF